jgi:DNA-binding NarL/FixJ family response regulator
MDLNLAPPGSGRKSGVDCVAAIKAALPGLQVLVLTVYDDSDRVFDALKAGASGYLLKRATTAEILDAIREVQVGGAPMSMQIARRVVESFRADRRPPDELDMLTPREREILALLAEGGLYKDIAKSLGLSTSTVRVHLHSVYTKLHVQTRTQAVLKYLGR